MGLYHEIQTFKTHLNELPKEDLEQVAYELFVELQNSRALNNSLKLQVNILQHAYQCQHYAKNAIES